MSERKVLNKYYPPDFDPTKLPKLKRDRNRQFVIRIMAPFSMRCTTCGEYIYKGRKFNSRMETVENETYLGLRVYRFYIRCTKCISEITFKTDPKNADYTMEQGATRNFEAVRRLGQMLEMEKEARAEEEANNPMKAIENRTRDSKREMESLEKLEELKDLNQRIAAIDPEKMIQDHLKVEENMLKQQEEEDERYIKQLFSGGASGYIKRIIDDNSDDEKQTGSSHAAQGSSKSYPTDILTANDEDLRSTQNITGPTYKPTLKTKLKTPLGDLSSMIRPKKMKTDNNVKDKEDIDNGMDINCKEDIDNSMDMRAGDDKHDMQEKTLSGIHVAALPAYKINLKKTVKSEGKIKGASLNLLGGYGSSDDSN